MVARLSIEPWQSTQRSLTAVETCIGSMPTWHFADSQVEGWLLGVI